MSKMGDHSLGNEEISRYSRQLILPEIGVEGNPKILLPQSTTSGLLQILEFANRI